MTKFVASFISIDFPAKHKMNFRRLNQSNLDALLYGNPFLTVIIGDFIAKSKDWCSIDITSFEGSELDFLTSQFGLSQIIKESTHILDNSRSCIVLIFTSQPNMVYTLFYSRIASTKLYTQSLI